MAWSHMVDWGSLWDLASLNTFLGLLNSSGTAVFGSLVIDLIVTHLRKYWSVALFIGHGNSLF